MDMSDSMISMIFIGVLGLLFILLVVLTIVLIVTRKKGDDEEYEDDDNAYSEEYDGGVSDTDDEYYQRSSEDSGDDESYDNDESTDDYDEAYDNDESSDNYNEAYDADGNSDDYDNGSDDGESDSDDESYDEVADTDVEPYEEATTKIENRTFEEPAAAGSMPQDGATNTDNQPNEKTTGEETNEPSNVSTGEEETDVLTAEDKVYRDELGDYSDSAFAPYKEDDSISNEEAIMASVKEAEAMSEAVIHGKPDAETMFGISDQLDSYKKKPVKRSTVSSNDDFYWYNKMDVAEKPSYKTKEMYYHYFNLPKDCIEDLLVEMYDCALVRTEEIRYIAYGIEPKAVSIKDILSEGNYYYSEQPKKKQPLPQDLIKIYEKWCGYVDKLFDKVEIHADEFTIQEIRKMLCEFGRNDVDVLIEGK